MKLLKGNAHAHVFLQIKNTLGERNVHQLEVNTSIALRF